MFVNDLRKEFYSVILGKRVLLLVNFDVDALCACKILQYLMQCDQIVYSLVPVSGIDDLKIAFNEHSEQIKHVVFINCGGTINLIDELQPEEGIVFFVLDSHRPIDVYNIYSADQIRLLMQLGEEENVPALEDIHREDDESEYEGNSGSENDEGSSERAAKRKRLDESAIERRIERREWEDKRDKILFDYLQFTYYGNSVAMLMFELAWKLSKDNNDILWWASIGLTDQLIHHKIEQTRYVLQAGSLQGHVSRLNHRNEDDNSTSVHCMKLSFDKELQLALYRHWSLHESLKHTTYTTCKFRLWTLKGRKRLYEFLADLGLPLAQCKQRFASMDLYLRNNVRGWMEEKVDKYGLEQLINGSFLAQFGFKHRFCASDYVYAASALLESGDKSKSMTENFLDALDCLSRCNLETLEHGIEWAKKQLSAIFIQVQTFLDLNQVISAGPFLYAVISESAPGSGLFSHPLCLARLAHWLLHAHVVVSRNRKSRNLPLILTAPGKEGKSLVVGIPPLSEDSPKNFFGQAFVQASNGARTELNNNFFDTHIIEIAAEESSKFFDALVTLLN